MSFDVRRKRDRITNTIKENIEMFKVDVLMYLYPQILYKKEGEETVNDIWIAMKVNEIAYPKNNLS